MKDIDSPIVDMATLRRDLCFVMSLLLADKKLAKAPRIVVWARNFHEIEVRRLMLWVAVALRGLLDLLETKDKTRLQEEFCGEYWSNFPSGTEKPLSFRQACNSVIHAKEILLYRMPKRETKRTVRRTIKRTYANRITVRGTHKGMTTRAQIDIIQFAQIADTLINFQEGNNADR